MRGGIIAGEAYCFTINVALCRIGAASCDLRRLRDGKMEADGAPTATFVVSPISTFPITVNSCEDGGGAYRSGLSGQGLNDPEPAVDIRKEFAESSAARFRMRGPCFNTAALIKIHSRNKIYSLC